MLYRNHNLCTMTSLQNPDRCHWGMKYTRKRRTRRRTCPCRTSCKRLPRNRNSNLDCRPSRPMIRGPGRSLQGSRVCMREQQSPKRCLLGKMNTKRLRLRRRNPQDKKNNSDAPMQRTCRQSKDCRNSDQVAQMRQNISQMGNWCNERAKSRRSSRLPSCPWDTRCRRSTSEIRSIFLTCTGYKCSPPPRNKTRQGTVRIRFCSWPGRKSWRILTHISTM